jgi:hypothetical protein
VVVMGLELRGEGRPMHHGGHGAFLSLDPSDYRQDQFSSVHFSI